MCRFVWCHADTPPRTYPSFADKVRLNLHTTLLTYKLNHRQQRWLWSFFDPSTLAPLVNVAREMAFVDAKHVPGTSSSCHTAENPRNPEESFHPICNCRGCLPQPHLLRSNRRSPLNQIPGQRSSHQFPIHPCINGSLE